MAEEKTATGKKGKRRKRAPAGLTVELLDEIQKIPVEKKVLSKTGDSTTIKSGLTDVETPREKKTNNKNLATGGKGEDVMSIDEELKIFMKEQDKFNRNFGTFVEEYTKREQRQAEGTRIKEEVKTATGPMQEKVGQFGKVLEKLQKELEPFGEICSSVEECKKKLKKFEEVAAAGEGKEKTLGDFSAQEKYDSIKKLLWLWPI